MGITSILPTRYRLNNKEYVLPLPQGLPISIFLNTEPLTYADFDNLVISAFDNQGNETFPDIIPLQKVDLGDGTYRIYFEDLIINSGVTYKEYYFVIYDSITDDVLLKLNCFQLLPTSSGDSLARLSYRNSSNIFNFNYEELPEFRNIIYVDLNAVDEQAEYDFTNYSEATTGYQRNQKSQLKNYVVMNSYKFDDRAHDAMKGLSMHDDIEINFQPYQVKEGYIYEPNRRTSRHEGTIELYIQNDNEINLNG